MFPDIEKNIGNQLEENIDITNLSYDELLKIATIPGMRLPEGFMAAVNRLSPNRSNISNLRSSGDNTDPTNTGSSTRGRPGSL